MKIKNEKRAVFRFPFYFYENEKQMRTSKIQNKNLLNMKLVVNYLNFIFHVKVKTKFKYKISFLNLSKTQSGTLGTWIGKDSFSLFQQGVHSLPE